MRLGQHKWKAVAFGAVLVLAPRQKVLADPSSTMLPPAASQPQTWEPAEVASAQAECDRALAGLSIKFRKVEPFRAGACGAPAAIEVSAFKSSGANGFIVLDPPAIMTCPLAALTQKWLDDSVTMHAKTLLNAQLTGLKIAASYDCRFRNGDPSAKISQHALANALDVAEFITTGGETISVADHWNGADAKSLFLHQVHQGACHVFGTTLGPDANAAHRTHFHLDAIKRKGALLCDFFNPVAAAPKTK